MIKAFPIKIFLLLLLSVAAIGSRAEPLVEMAERAEKKYTQGDYREAFELYKSALLDNGYDARHVDDDLEKAVDSLQKLGAENEFDFFIENLVEAHQDDWRVYKAAAVQYRNIVKRGYIVAGEFNRGDHRGGQGRFVDSSERDRVRALQLLQKAYALTKNRRPTSSEDTKSVLYEMSMALMQNRYDQSAWKLQHLTDLEQLPDYE